MVEAVARDSGSRGMWPASSLEVLGHCPICGTADRHQLYAGLEDRQFGVGGRWNLYACAGCTVAYLDPRPSRSGLHLAYENYHTHEERLGDDPADVTQPGWDGIKQIAIQQYLRLRFGPRRSAIRNLPGIAVLLRPRLRRTLDSIMRHLPRPRPGDTLLDIGCGSGWFMAWARWVGWTCVGTEVDPVAAGRARARGFEVHLREAGELASGGTVFDAVTLSHVIEHVHEPAALLRAARRLLRPDGYLWIETPNIASHGHDCFRCDWRGLEPPRHLQIFTPGLLKEMLAEAGFRNIRTAPWQLDWTAMLQASLPLTGNKAPEMQLDPRVIDGEDVGRRSPAKREFITLTARAPASREHDR